MSSQTKTVNSWQNTKGTIVIVCDVPEKVSTNKIYAGLHWTERSRLKNLYAQYMLQFRGLYKIYEYPVRIKYTFTWHKNALDSTNQSFIIKMLEDGIKNIGLIPDDNYKYVEETVSITKLDKKAFRDTVIIEIESINKKQTPAG